MNDNKELNTLLDNLFSSVKNSYDISGMIRDIKEKEVDKDYEIILLTYQGIIYPYAEIKSSFDNWEGQHNKNDAIHSVKRNSDSETFTVGDKTIYGVIESFKLEPFGGISVWFTNGCCGTLSSLTKVKDRVPLLKTEDGKEIFEEYNTIFGLNTNNWLIEKYHPLRVVHAYCMKYFSTEDKAKEYQLMNKPCLSITDVVSVDHAGNGKVAAIVLVKLIDIVSKKINNQ